MKTPIELAKEHGADYDFYADENVPSSKIEVITFSKEQLEAYSRALVAPYVEALEYVDMWVKECCKSKKSSSMVEDLIMVRIEEALAAHREMFGGE